MGKIRSMSTMTVRERILVQRKCEECSDGVYHRGDEDMVLLSKPPQYAHLCTNCGDQRNFTRIYPHIEMRDIPFTKKELADVMAAFIKTHKKVGDG
jgi:hypothetical protein